MVATSALLLTAFFAISLISSDEEQNEDMCLSAPGDVGYTFNYTHSGTQLQYYVTVANSEVRVEAFISYTVGVDPVIPNSVTDNGIVYGVTSIRDGSTHGDGVFSNIWWAVTSIIIPDSIKTVGDYAFYNCHNSTGTLTIPDSVETIGVGAFYGCSDLTSVTIGSSVKTIGDEAFRGCSDLLSVTIGNSVETIGDYAFWSCSSLTFIDVDSANLNYSSDEHGVLFNADRTMLIYYPLGKIGNYTIPDSVEAIEDYAFYKCSGLTSVTIGSSVKTIGDAAFRDCSNLTGTLVIPDSVETIGKLAFSCSNPTGVLVIPDSVETIGGYAFYECSGLTSVTIGNSVETVEDYTFYGCSDMMYAIIGNSVETIGYGAFWECSSLISVTIGDSVKTIRGEVFIGCSHLTFIGTNIANLNYSSDEHGVLFNADKTILILYPMGKIGNYAIPDSVKTIEAVAFSGCSGLTSVTIGNSVETIGDNAFSGSGLKGTLTVPNSVKTIGGCAFSGCSGLTSVTIGNSVETIGYGAFWECSGLTSVTIGNSVETIGYNAFSGCSRLYAVAIPAGTYFNSYDLQYTVKIVYYSMNGVGSVTATRPNTNSTGTMALTIATTGTVANIKVGTTLGGSNITPTGSGNNWTFSYNATNEYYVNVNVNIPVITYTVTYSLTSSLGTGMGTVPTETNKAAGAAFSAASASGLTAPAGKQFKQWNTKADGTGTAYGQGQQITMPASAVTLYAIWMDTPATVPIHNVAGGADKEWTKGNRSGGLTITINGDRANFKEVRVNGNLVDPSNYSVTIGSTIITFKQAYLNSLANGVFDVEVLFTDGVASATLIVSGDGSGNGDGFLGDIDPMILAVIAIVAIGGIGAVAFFFLRKH